MLKKGAIRRIFISSFALILLLIIYLIPTNNKDDNHPTIIYEQLKTIPVYLQDSYHYVSRININSSNDDIKYIVELLTINGKYSNQIPKGFKAIIPQNTELIEYTDETAQIMIENSVQKVRELFGQYSTDKLASYEYREATGAKYHEFDDLARVND